MNFLEKYHSFIDGFISIRSQINRLLNILFGLIAIISIVLLFCILYTNNEKLYVPFALSISITIAILAIKANIRDKIIEHHFNVTKDVKTNLHILISYLNILKNMQAYIGEIYTGESKIQKQQLIRTQKKYEEMLSKIYNKESLVHLNPEDITKLESIQTNCIMFNGELDLIISKLADDFIGNIPMENVQFRIHTSQNILKNIEELQKSVEQIISKKYEPYQQIAEQENENYEKNKIN